MLFHFSENPNIKEFIPQAADGMPPMFWEIDEEHAANYFFPRDCPRVIYSRSDNISLEDELHPIALIGCITLGIFSKSASNASYWMHSTQDFYQK